MVHCIPYKDEDEWEGQYRERETATIMDCIPHLRSTRTELIYFELPFGVSIQIVKVEHLWSNCSFQHADDENLIAFIALTNLHKSIGVLHSTFTSLEEKG